jgi:hypothetical protein
MGEKDNLQGNEELEANPSKLYTFDRNSHSELIEDQLIHCYLNTKNEGMKRSVVRAVASSILVMDLAKIAGVGGEDTKRRVVENGCLPHLKKIPKIGALFTENYPDENPKSWWDLENPQKNSEFYEQVGKRICDLLESLKDIELTDEEWDESYRLYVRRRNSKRRELSQRQKP